MRHARCAADCAFVPLWRLLDLVYVPALQIREILLADRAPGTGNQVKEVDGSAEVNGADASVSEQIAAEDVDSNGMVSGASKGNGVSAQQDRKNITILGKADSSF